jgi:uncharacterized heparinase superfamily protein
MSPSRALLYGRTILNLRPVQIADRVLRRFRSSEIRNAPSLPLRDLPSPSVRPIARPQSIILPGEFRFLNQSRRIEGAAAWNDPAVPRLWLYNLHYFDDLGADGPPDRLKAQAAFIERWIDENPPGHGAGWEPYALSLRIVNWIKFHLQHRNLSERMLDNLAMQGRSLCRQIEYHLLGNHLLANAKALVFLGVFFAGPQADDWLRTGLAILARQLREQILRDGMHFERSPMYHAILTEDVLDLIWLARLTPQELPDSTWQQTAARMLDAMQTMAHPDGAIAYFNDSTFGIAPDLSAIYTYARALDVPVPTPPPDGIAALADSGYIRLQNGDAVVLFDAALPGPRYLLGHGHADTLSIEMSLFGARLFLNAGTSQYAPGSQRQKERSTPSHNTVTVDGRNSSEIWGEFRMARYARPLDVRWEEQGKIARAQAAHDGYRRQFGGPLHRRTLELHEKCLTVRDALEGGRWVRAEARFLLAPGTLVHVIDGRMGTLTHEGRPLTWQVEGAAAHITSAEFHPGFNLTEPAQCLIVEAQGPKMSFILKW